MQGEKDIYIWGTGNTANDFWYLTKEKYNLIGAFDSSTEKQGQLFNGVCIKQFENSFKTDAPIIICSIFWKEIAIKLIESGMVPFKDFLLWKWLIEDSLLYSDFYELSSISKNMTKGIDYFSIIKTLRNDNKKICVVYGNCQADVLAKNLLLCDSFCNDYIVVVVPKICHYHIPNLKDMVWYFSNDIALFKGIDLFIYQIISDDNYFSRMLSSNSLLRQLRNDCEAIAILPLVFYGYFPQIDRKKYIEEKDFPDNRDEEKYVTFFCYADECLKQEVDNWHNEETNDFINKVFERINRQDYFDKKYVEQYAKQSLEMLKETEKKVDVKITDYIEGKYKEIQLFSAPRHPVAMLHREYAYRVIKHIYGDVPYYISEDESVANTTTARGMDCPIYPSVAKHLGLKQRESHIYTYGRIMRTPFDFERYVKMYLKLLLEGAITFRERDRTEDDLK